ncbi:MAG: acyltransferase [Epsilonproteobacteria bacterium]|nr:acyltransferase [Campylobacterota bacterium]
MNNDSIDRFIRVNELNKYTFEEIKDYINIQQMISLKSTIYLNKQSFENLKTNTLKLTIKRLTAENGIFNIKLVFLATNGEFILRYWDDSSYVIVNEDVRGIYTIDCASNSFVYIGKHTTSNGTHMICMDSEVQIGDDCMFSDGILIQATDQHGVVDIKKKQIINKHRRCIEIQNHVWLARNCTVISDVTIGEGSIVSLGAVVVKNVPKRSIVAGIPAKVVKQDMTWSRFRKNFDNYSKKIIDIYGERDFD